MWMQDTSDHIGGKSCFHFDYAVGVTFLLKLDDIVYVLGLLITLVGGNSCFKI